MKKQSVYQKYQGKHREPGTGTVKMYESGIVGYQLPGQEHCDYAKAMKPLASVTPQNGDALLTKYFGN